MLEHIVLGMLIDGPQTGYDLKKLIETGVGTFYKASYGSLYPLLKRLAERGLLSVREEAYGNRQKKYYQITEEGKSAFEGWLASPISLTESTDDQLVRVYFFDRLPAACREEKLAEYELANRHYLQRLQGLLARFEGMEHRERFYYKLSTLYYGISVMQATVNWCGLIRKRGELADLLKTHGQEKEEPTW